MNRAANHDGYHVFRTRAQYDRHRAKYSLEDDIEFHEGLHLEPYTDTEGYWTIGIGHRLSSSKNISQTRAKRLAVKMVGKRSRKSQAQFWRGIFKKDVAKARKGAENIIKKYRLFIDEPAQDALVNMNFQMGEKKVSKFGKTIWAMQRGLTDLVHEEALNSRWASQTPVRAREVASLFGISGYSGHPIAFTPIPKLSGKGDWVIGDGEVIGRKNASMPDAGTALAVYAKQHNPYGTFMVSDADRARYFMQRDFLRRVVGATSLTKFPKQEEKPKVVAKYPELSGFRSQVLQMKNMTEQDVTEAVSNIKTSVASDVQRLARQASMETETLFPVTSGGGGW